MARNSKSVGDETEVAILYRLISCGYAVSTPFGDNQKYDLIADDGNSLYRLQCKTAWETMKETIRFHTHPQTTKDGEYHERTYAGSIDGILVRHPGPERFYLIPESDITDQKMELRYESKIDHPAINWANDYRFQGDLSILYQENRE